MRFITKGAADQTVEVHIRSKATGEPYTGLVFNTAGLTAYYTRTRGLATAITLATLAQPDTTHTDGGFKEIDATNRPGDYRLDLPDAVCASGVDAATVRLRGAANMIVAGEDIQLTGDDLQIAKPTNYALLSINGSGQVVVSSHAPGAIAAASFAAGAIDNAAIAAEAIGSSELAASAVTEIQSGLATSVALASLVTTIGTPSNATIAADILDVTATLGDVSSAVTNTIPGLINDLSAVIGPTVDDIVVGSATATTVTASAGTLSSVDDFYVGQLFRVVEGAGLDQVRAIVAYNGTTKVFTVDRAWQTNPNGTSFARILPADNAKLDSSLRVTSVDDAAIKAKTDNLPADPADASDVAAAFATAAAAIAAVQGDTDNIQTRLPAALTAGGNMKSDALAINGDTTAASNLAKTAGKAILRGTVGVGSSTTSIVTSALDVPGTSADQFKGHAITFDKDTATAGLRGTACVITASSISATPTLTVSTDPNESSPLPAAPASGDTFSVT